MFFQKEKREQIKKDNPTLKTLPQVAKKMGEIWGNMTDDQKKPYNEMAGKDKVRYEQESKAYKEKKAQEEKDKKAQEEKEKKKEKEEREKEEDSDDEEDGSEDESD